MNRIDQLVNAGGETTLTKYRCGKVDVICNKRVILSGLKEPPFEKPLTTFYPSEYTNGFNLVVYAYISEGYTPADPVFDPDFRCVRVPDGTEENGTDVITRFITIAYEQTCPNSPKDGPFSLWEIRIIYSVGYENPDDSNRTQAVHVHAGYEDDVMDAAEGSTRLGTIAQSLEEFDFSKNEDIEFTPKLIHGAIVAPPLEPLVTFNPSATAVDGDIINLKIYAFIPVGFEPLAVKFNPPQAERPPDIAMKGEDNPEHVRLYTRSISIWYATSALDPKIAFGDYAIWEIAVSYIDPHAQMIRVCYCVGDPVTTRGTVTSVQRT